jgi:hypothetical protein
VRKEQAEAGATPIAEGIQGLTIKILKGLGEKAPESALQVRKERCKNRDIAIYILYQIGAVFE